VSLCDDAIEIGLLFGNGVLGAFDLIGAYWIDGALIQAGKQGLKPDANWI